MDASATQDIKGTMELRKEQGTPWRQCVGQAGCGVGAACRCGGFCIIPFLNVDISNPRLSSAVAASYHQQLACENKLLNPAKRVLDALRRARDGRSSPQSMCFAFIRMSVGLSKPTIPPRHYVLPQLQCDASSGKPPAKRDRTGEQSLGADFYKRRSMRSIRRLGAIYIPGATCRDHCSLHSCRLLSSVCKYEVYTVPCFKPARPCC